ncbi:MAG: DUF1761 domain-containing protein [Alphaproteobacteria bacterium]|nr:DUF1761 domain-containing protein [Alphaproteobacteria bacterium]
MSFAGINFAAVAVAAMLTFAFGAVWYMALSKPWMQAVGLKPEDAKPSPKLFGLTLLCLLVMAWVLAGILGHLGPGQVTIRNGLITGGFLWLGCVATTLIVNNAYAFRKSSLTLIDGGHWLGVLLIQGAVLGAFGA